ncbi:MAG: ExeA family protein [Desulfuromonadales bacterium]
MLYLQHFGLREPPFSLTPDTGFFYNTSGHREALEVLRVALRSGEGFIKIIGEVGTGKTLLCRKLLNALEGDTWVTAYLPNPLLGVAELYRALADELGIGLPVKATVNDNLKAINSQLIDLARQGRRVVLCIDEVQVMPEKSLEALRLLSNLETEKRKLLQIVLFAQPELEDRLQQPGLRQLRQRLAFSYRLPPLDHQGVSGYVGHRLLVAGHQGGALFAPGALKLLARGSRGIPRLINILCHKAMLSAYGRGESLIGTRHMLAAIRDTDDAQATVWRDYLPWLYVLAALIIGLEISALVYLARGGAS